jgi:hypothetical protein
MPDNLALDWGNFHRYDLAAYHLPCTYDIDPTANLDQLLWRDCLLGLSPYVVQGLLN